MVDEMRFDERQTNVLAEKVTRLICGHVRAEESLIYDLMDSTLDMLESGRMTEAQRELRRELEAEFCYTDAPESYEFTLGAVWALMGLVTRTEHGGDEK